MERKKTLIIVGAIFFVYLFVVGIFLVYYYSKKTSIQDDPNSLKPTVTQDQSLKVMSLSPADGEDNVPLDQMITIEFNRFPLSGEYSVTLKEDDLYGVYYTLSAKGNIVTVQPKGQLKEAKLYVVKITDVNGRIYEKSSFATVIETTKSDTRPVELITQTEIQTKKERPDIFLANKLPYESAAFQMHLEIDANTDFVFIVESDTYDGLELVDEVKAWLLSLDLTTKQISTLNILYL